MLNDSVERHRIFEIGSIKRRWMFQIVFEIATAGFGGFTMTTRIEKRVSSNFRSAATFVLQISKFLD
jgi:hypothetical protein